MEIAIISLIGGIGAAALVAMLWYALELISPTDARVRAIIQERPMRAGLPVFAQIARAAELMVATEAIKRNPCF
jgi:hypothetical protein